MTLFRIALLQILPSKAPENNLELGLAACHEAKRLGADLALFPKVRALAQQGAEIILTPNACRVHHDEVLGDVRIAQFRARAFENMVGVAMANSGPGITMATFDLAAIRKWRETEVWGPMGAMLR